MLVHACNSSTWEAEAGKVQVQGYPGLYIMRPYFKEQKEDEWTDRRKGMKQNRIKLVFTFNNFAL